MFGVGKYFLQRLTPRTFGACPSLLKERGEDRLRASG